MNHLHSKESPLVISNIKQLSDKYDLLARRRSSLVREMSEHPTSSRHLHTLHRNELKILRTHLVAIEDFLQSYKFIHQRGSFR